MSEQPTRLSGKGVRFIAGWEGFSATPYKPVAGEQYLTIGYGHYGPDVKPNDHVTERQARKLLRSDAREAAEAVGKGVKVRLSQHAFDALVSFTFNVGVGAFGSSTLLRRLNDGERDAVPEELMRWTHGEGGQLAGLVTRRKAEGRLFADGKYDSDH